MICYIALQHQFVLPVLGLQGAKIYNIRYDTRNLSSTDSEIVLESVDQSEHHNTYIIMICCVIA